MIRQPPSAELPSSLQVFNYTIITKRLPLQSRSRMLHLQHSPMIPQPPSFDVARRVAELQKMLDDDNIAARQKDNIKVIIKMYENGELPKRIGELASVQDGRVCRGFPDVQKGTPWWTEVCLMQNADFMMHFTYSAQRV
jgi:hypothetical protein